MRAMHSSSLSPTKRGLWDSGGSSEVWRKGRQPPQYITHAYALLGSTKELRAQAPSQRCLIICMTSMRRSAAQGEAQP